MTDAQAVALAETIAELWPADSMIDRDQLVTVLAGILPHVLADTTYMVVVPEADIVEGVADALVAADMVAHVWMAVPLAEVAAEWANSHGRQVVEATE